MDSALSVISGQSCLTISIYAKEFWRAIPFYSLTQLPCARPHIGSSCPLLTSLHRSGFHEGQTMTKIFKAVMITAAFALTIGLAAATLSAPAMADDFSMCGDNPSGTC